MRDSGGAAVVENVLSTTQIILHFRKHHWVNLVKQTNFESRFGESIVSGGVLTKRKRVHCK